MIPKKSWRFSAYIVPASLLALGALIYAYGSLFPQYNDPNALARLNDKIWFEQESDPATAAKWFAFKATLQTPRDPCHDLGAGIFLLGAALAILFLTRKIRNFSDLRDLSTPKSPLRFCLLVNFVWLSFIPAAWCYFIYTFSRGDYPPYSDIIFIPLMGVFMFGMVGWPVALFCTQLAIYGRELPLPIWSKPAWHHVNVISILIWLALICAVCVLGATLIESPPFVPSTVFSINLLLSAKAAAAAPNQNPWGLR